MKNKITIRKAKLKDVLYIRKLVNEFASKGKMLSLSLNQIYERLRDFWVIEKNKKIIGCGALKITWDNLGELRSLAISPLYQKKGYGKILVEKMIQEAVTLELKKIFALTYVPNFFKQFGFKKITKSKLPHKIWFDCINCPKFPDCDEIALIKTL